MKLLVIEDDTKVAAAIRRGLQAEGFDVTVAGNGLDGLWLALEAGFDLVVLDLMLPGRNGFRVCDDLRRAGRWMPILVLTAKDGDLDEADALDTGADDYLAKPFSFPVLVARVRALLRRAELRRPAPMIVAGLTIDAGQRRVSRHGDAVELTAREFDVLQFLVRRAGQVQSKHEILVGVWPDDFDGDPNIVEVYVRRLRRKLDGPDDEPIIETVRGAGYLVASDA